MASGVESNPTREMMESLFSVERVKTFIDAVIAIAITLLILPLMESASELNETAASLGEWMIDHFAQLYGFLISFFIIAMFWAGHRRLFEKVTGLSPVLLRMNLVWLLTVVWLPVATALTGHVAGADHAVTLLYIGSMFATSLVWLLIRVHLARHPQLHTASPAETVAGVVGASARTLLFVVAAGLALLVPRVNAGWLVLMVLAGVVGRWLRPLFGRWQPAAGTGGAPNAA